MMKSQARNVPLKSVLNYISASITSHFVFLSGCWDSRNAQNSLTGLSVDESYLIDYQKLFCARNIHFNLFESSLACFSLIFVNCPLDLKAFNSSADPVVSVKYKLLVNLPMQNFCRTFRACVELVSNFLF